MEEDTNVSSLPMEEDTYVGSSEFPWRLGHYRDISKKIFRIPELEENEDILEPVNRRAIYSLVDNNRQGSEILEDETQLAAFIQYES